MIQAHTQTAYFASNNPQYALAKVEVLRYGFEMSLCDIAGSPTRVPNSLLFQTFDGAIEYTRMRFRETVKELEAKIVNEHMASAAFELHVASLKETK